MGRAAASSVRSVVRRGPVRAVRASPAASGAAGSVPADPVRALQHALYRAAKVDPGRRFHALRDKIFRKDVLWRAWVAVFHNDGAPGIDKAALADVKEYGVARLLDELAVELRDGGYRPLPNVGCSSRSRDGGAAAAVDSHGPRIGPSRPVSLR